MASSLNNLNVSTRDYVICGKCRQHLDQCLCKELEVSVEAFADKNLTDGDSDASDEPCTIDSLILKS